MTEQVIDIDISKVLPSPFNPRSKLPNMEAITASIKERGIQYPLLVRPVMTVDNLTDGPFEIVDGHRRFQGALNTNRIFVPCIVRHMSDDEAMELQLIAALQREDIHPYEEALAINKLLIGNGGDYKGVANKIGKPEAYVRRRSQLGTLIPKAAELFVTDKITLGAAFALSRMQHPDQAACLKEAKNGKDINENRIDWYAKEILRELKSVPWDVNDPDLVPAAGPCSTCPKQTGAEPLLFAEVQSKAVCTDGVCFDTKIAAFIIKAKEETPGLVLVRQGYTSGKFNELPGNKWRELAKSSKECPTTLPAIITDLQFKRVRACTNGGRCPVHGSGSGTALIPATPEQKAQRKDELKESRDKAALGVALFDAILENQAAWHAVKGKRLVAEFLWSRVWHDLKRDYFKASPGLVPGQGLHGGKDYSGPVEKLIEKADGEELSRLLLSFALMPLLSKNSVESATKSMSALFSINLAPLKKEIAAQSVKPDKPKPAKKKRSASKRKRMPK